ncbi:hypothetical protein PMAYCL1PPCAC_01730, partial [Pristionchus mayeri]
MKDMLNWANDTKEKIIKLYEENFKKEEAKPVEDQEHVGISVAEIVNTENIANCIINILYEVIKVKRDIVWSTIKPITDKIYETKFCENFPSSKRASLQLATLLMDRAFDHMLIYKNAITELLQKCLTSTPSLLEVEAAMWTLEAMTERDEWKGTAAGTVGKLEKLIARDAARDDYDNIKTTEMAIFALVK